MGTMKQSGLWSSLGTNGCVVVIYGGNVFPVVARPENSTFQMKFNLEGQGQFRGQASDWHTDWHTHTDAGDDNTRRPKLASG